MKRTLLILLLTAGTAAASAQTQPAGADFHCNFFGHCTVKLPAGIPPGAGKVDTAFSLRYQDLKIGVGAEAEPNKIYKVHYTGWLAADGRKFDSTYDHPGPPIVGKDGKIVRDANGKVITGDPQPITFIQGTGRAIPGFDQGFAGMKVGGKRRLFIPWQMAYGTLGRPGPDAAHQGIPPKADLIFDVELVDVSDPPKPPTRPGPSGMRMPPRGNTPHPAAPAQPNLAPGTTTAPAAPAPVAPVTPSAPATPTQPATPAQPK
jgi:peptidylprolyl isomerase